MSPRVLCRFVGAVILVLGGAPLACGGRTTDSHEGRVGGAFDEGPSGPMGDSSAPAQGEQAATTCPPDEPPLGGSCSGTLECSYTERCTGKEVHYGCYYGSWVAHDELTECPENCPPTQPDLGTTCAEDTRGYCVYAERCGGKNVRLMCSGGYWIASDSLTACPDECPAVEPVPGASCTQAGPGDCWYNDRCSGQPVSFGCYYGSWVAHDPLSWCNEHGCDPNGC